MQRKKPNKVTIKEQVYEIIKEMILSQEYQPGEKIKIDLKKSRLIKQRPARHEIVPFRYPRLGDFRRDMLWK